jgi:uncharacterized membrane protein (DUF485 family)
MSQSEPTNASTTRVPASMARKMFVSFSIFGIFFVFYVGAALVQSPAGKGIATIPVAGVPLGLLLSLIIFPLSWLLIAIWFWKAR